jgi:hypothetical protein
VEFVTPTFTCENPAIVANEAAANNKGFFIFISVVFVPID